MARRTPSSAGRSASGSAPAGTNTPRTRPERDDDPASSRGGSARGNSRGRDADSPQEIPAAGWKDIAARVKTAVKRDRVPLASAGVAFYAMLALFPALTAFLSLFGLVADPDQAAEQIEGLTENLGGGAGDLISDQVQSIAGAGQGALTTGLALSIIAALWTASSGMNGLMEALTLAHKEDETRGLVKRRAIALGLTLVAMVFVALAIGSIVVVPLVIGALGLGEVGEWAVRILRWPIVAAFLLVALAAVYRYAPNRANPAWRWVSAGAVIAMVLWVLGSIAFSIYVQNFGNYNETYGALGGVIVLLLWLFVSSFVVVLGAVINAEAEHQTSHDTTDGDPQPKGLRGAEVADHVGESSS